MSWTPQTIVARDWGDVDVGTCARNSITINRLAHTVAYDSMSANAEKPWCRKFHKPEDHHWVIGQPKQPWER